MAGNLLNKPFRRIFQKPGHRLPAWPPSEFRKMILQTGKKIFHVGAIQFRVWTAARLAGGGQVSYSPDRGIEYSLQRAVLPWGEARGRKCIPGDTRPTEQRSPRAKRPLPAGLLALLACGFVARRVTERCGYAPLLAPRHKPKSPATNCVLSRGLVSKMAGGDGSTRAQWQCIVCNV